jgi:hypothetical protein
MPSDSPLLAVDEAPVVETEGHAPLSCVPRAKGRDPPLFSFCLSPGQQVRISAGNHIVERVSLIRFGKSEADRVARIHAG